MSKLEIEINGMTCGHCAMSISKELSAVPGVHVLEVNHESGKALVESDAEESLLAEAIEKAGYIPVKFEKVDA